MYLPVRYPGEAKPGNHWPFLASILKDFDDVEVTVLTETSLVSLPEEPLRNRDFDAHGRKTASDACVVTVDISLIWIPKTEMDLRQGYCSSSGEYTSCCCDCMCLCFLFVFHFRDLLVVRICYCILMVWSGVVKIGWMRCYCWLNWPIRVCNPLSSLIWLTYPQIQVFVSVG